MKSYDHVKWTRLIPALVAFSAFFLGGLYFFYVENIHPWMMQNEAQDWEATDCTIESSRVQKLSDTDSDTDSTPSYSPDISYRYNFDGRRFHSDRYSFAYGGRTNRSEIAKIVERYPEGKTVTCYVNPENPEEAVISRSYTEPLLARILIPMFFMLVGLAGLILFPMYKNRIYD